MSNRTGTQATSFCTSQCVCESCELKKIIQQETKIQESIVRSKKMQADSSTIKKTADTLDILTNHAGNLAFSITVFVKHLTHAVYHILNGIPWINLIFMIIGGLFRIASVFLIKDTPLWQKIAVATLGIATISLGIAGLIAFSMFMGLALMAASAAVDLVTSLMSFGKTVVDYVKLKRKFGNTELTESEKDELKPHKLKNDFTLRRSCDLRNFTCWVCVLINSRFASHWRGHSHCRCCCDHYQICIRHNRHQP